MIFFLHLSRLELWGWLKTGHSVFYDFLHSPNNSTISVNCSFPLLLCCEAFDVLLLLSDVENKMFNFELC